MRAEWKKRSGLDRRSFALVKLAALITRDAPAPHLNPGPGARAVRGPYRHCLLPGRLERRRPAIARFAPAYADQNEHDHQALLHAVNSGRLTAE
jgi:hypothetical protein